MRPQQSSPRRIFGGLLTGLFGWFVARQPPAVTPTSPAAPAPALPTTWTSTNSTSLTFSVSDLRRAT